MGKKKSVDEFKRAFGAIKKPKRPKPVTGKMKTAIEKAVGKEDSDTFVENIKELVELDRDYAVDLIAYKIAKHFDSDDKRPFWHNKVPPDVLKDALEKVVPDGLDSKVTQKILEKATVDGAKSTIAVIYLRDPEKACKFCSEKVVSFDGKDQAKERLQWSNAMTGSGMDGEGWRKETTKLALAKGNVVASKELGQALGSLPEGSILEIAKTNPKVFFQTALEGFKDSGTDFINALKDKDLRDELEKLDPKAWKTFVDKTPMLASLRGAEAKVKAKKKEKEKLGEELTSQDIMDAMFDAVLDKTNMPLAYSSTAFDSNHSIMTGPTEKSTEFRAEQKKMLDLPEEPATDCHHLLYIAQTMMEMYPGVKPKIHNESCPNMLMTKPLKGIPGRGTLDRSFPGNVFGDDDQATGRILFTGDNGINSHTWLNVDGEFYDPVLGTKGKKQVTVDAVEMTMDWVIPGRLAKEKGGDRYAVKDPKLKVAGNKMGFSTGYYLTNDPGRYLTEEEKVQAKL